MSLSEMKMWLPRKLYFYNMANELWLCDVLCLCTMILIYLSCVKLLNDMANDLQILFAVSLCNDFDLSYVKPLYDMANDLWSFDVTCLCTLILIYPMSNHSMMRRMICDHLMCCVSVQWCWFIFCQTTLWYGEWLTMVWCDVDICTMNLIYPVSIKNRSTNGCSKLRRSVDMRSSWKNGLNIRTNASPKWDRTRCAEE